MGLSSAYGQPNTEDTPLLRVMEVYSGIGGVEKHLWLQVGKNGMLEWEEHEQSGENISHSSTVSAAQLSHLEEILSSLNWKEFRGHMGPYNVYKDTGVDLQFVIRKSNGDRRFSVGNPWPGGQIRPLPIQLKRLICELESIRSQAEGRPQGRWCSAG